MQLDADEDGEPFFKPPATGSAPLRQKDEQPDSEEQHRAQQNITSETSGPREEGENEQGAVSVTQAEPEG